MDLVPALCYWAWSLETRGSPEAGMPRNGGSTNAGWQIIPHGVSWETFNHHWEISSKVLLPSFSQWSTLPTVAKDCLWMYRATIWTHDLHFMTISKIDQNPGIIRKKCMHSMWSLSLIYIFRKLAQVIVGVGNAIYLNAKRVTCILQLGLFIYSSSLKRWVLLLTLYRNKRGSKKVYSLLLRA